MTATVKCLAKNVVEEEVKYNYFYIKYPILILNHKFSRRKTKNFRPI